MHFQRVPGHEPGTQFGQPAFGFAAEIIEEMLGDDQLENRVSQKLEPLIIEMMPVRFVPETRVRQRLRKQERVAKFVADPFLQWIHAMFKLIRHGADSRNSAGEAIHRR